MSQERNITHAAKLLSDVAEGLKDLEEGYKRKQAEGACYPPPVIDLAHVGITLYEEDEEVESVVWDGGLSDFLLNLSNDTYWDESSRWDGATKASVSYGG